MKTKVNLYAIEFHPKLRLLSLQITLVVCAVMLLLCVAYWFYGFAQQQSLTTELEFSQLQKSQHAGVVTALQTELATLKKDPQLLLDVEQNLQILALKKRVLEEIQGQEELKSSGFAQLMAELADKHQSGLWLTYIGLDGRQVRLEGTTLESSLVPKWLNNLGATAYFKGQEFAETRLFRNTEQQLNFVIASSVADAKDNASAGANVNE
ncbi:PilN domain-containing protein [Paraglaciecola hydrolytica]|uniref:Fimbrial assembly protein n=1 Tax=Paraglaciecola hydrolytica TaxID=1799789 RepID=A0A136A4Q3_9ALTE|nr:PilN domain-containing protein [Paraglaciecola hydrolytica]KXI30100.1 hypothetical protein AX660_08870 [Paraglaciecola hydrolytica]